MVRRFHLLGFVCLMAVTSIAFVAAAATHASARPSTIVSLNMCTDQLVLALADRDQIAGLSRFAANERLSFAAEDAQGFPLLPAAAEAVIALEPDLILTGRFTNRAAKDMLRGFGYRVEEVPFVRSLDEARSAIALVGELVGYPDRAEALIADLDAALAAPQPSAPLSALLIQRRGYATGTASLTADLLATLGVTLASEDLVGARGGFADLETILRSQPDVLITASLDIDIEDQGTALLAHPALQAGYPAHRRMSLPERLTLCAGLSLLDAVEHITRERDAVLQRLEEHSTGG